MAKTKLLIIKAVLAITRMLDADFVQRLYKIYDGLLKNPASALGRSDPALVPQNDPPRKLN